MWVEIKMFWKKVAKVNGGKMDGSSKNKGWKWEADSSRV